MKTDLFMFQLKAVKMFIPQLDKGERNPYTTGSQVGNPFMKDLKIEIKDDDIQDVLELLKSKGYDVSKMEIEKE